MIEDDTASAPQGLSPPPLPQPKPWGLWTTLGWVVFVLVATLVLDAVVAALFGFDYADVMNGTRASVSGCVTNLLTIGLVIAIIRLRSGWDPRKYLALLPVSVSSIVFWLIVIAAFGFVYDSLMTFLDRPVVPEENRVMYATASNKLLLFALIVVAAPIGEEVLFRGFAFCGWSQTRFGEVGAVIITSVFFGMLHMQYDIYGITGAAVIGALLGTARMRTGSIYPCIAMHMTNNLIAYFQTANAVAHEYILI